jgi:hypothetical protein
MTHRPAAALPQQLASCPPGHCGGHGIAQRRWIAQWRSGADRFVAAGEGHPRRGATTARGKNTWPPTLWPYEHSADSF